MTAQPPLQVGLVGVGRWGARYLDALSQVPGIALVAVCDVDAEARERVSSRSPGLQVVSSTAAMLELPIDAAIVATPGPTHAEVAIACLRRRKHVLVEKPMATTVSDAASMVEEARRASRAMLVGHLLFHHPAVQWLLAHADGGRLGRLREYRAIRHSCHASLANDSALWELGPHDVSIVLRLFGAPDRVRCTAQAGHAQLELVHTRGRSRIELSRAEPTPRRQIELLGTLGTAVVDEVRSNGRLLDPSGRVLEEHVFGGREAVLRLQVEHFKACILGSVSTPGGSGREGAEVVRVLATAAAGRGDSWSRLQPTHTMTTRTVELSDLPAVRP